MDGVLVVDKPEGPTSHDVVARARRVLGTRSIGHTGTLDPMATGVLVLLVGRATRLAQFLAAHRKGYDAVIRLGTVTDTWDRTGTTVTATAGTDTVRPTLSDISSALSGFLGPGAQAPPPYSAKKVDGVRAHVLARRGRDVAIPPAAVELHAATVLAAEWPLVSVRLLTSAGYYVRSLAHDLGRALGCGACLETLRRTSSGDYDLSSAVALDWLESHAATAPERLLPLEQALPGLPSVTLDEDDAGRARHGNEVRVPPESTGGVEGASCVRLFSPDGRLLAIARPTGRPGLLHPAVVLG